MLAALMVQLALAAQPDSPEVAPAPRPKTPGVTLVLANGDVLRLDEGRLEYYRVETAQGPKIRVRIRGEVTLDSTVVQFREMQAFQGFVQVLRLGKDGGMLLDTFRDPARPAPPPRMLGAPVPAKP